MVSGTIYILSAILNDIWSCGWGILSLIPSALIGGGGGTVGGTFGSFLACIGNYIFGLVGLG